MSNTTENGQELARHTRDMIWKFEELKGNIELLDDSSSQFEELKGNIELLNESFSQWLGCLGNGRMKALIGGTRRWRCS